MTMNREISPIKVCLLKDDRLSSFFVYLSLALIFCLLSACEAKKIPKFDASEIQDQVEAQEQNGITVSIHPMLNEAQNEKYFGADLLSNNVLAVYFSSRNANRSSSFLLLRENINLGKASVVDDDGLIRSDVGDMATGRQLQFTAALLLPIILGPIGNQMVLDASAINHNLLTSQFRSQTLSPGESIVSFLYFQIPDEKKLENETLLLRVAIQDTKTKDLIQFDFVFTLQER